MTPVVAVIAPGMMGAAVGKRLVDNGVKVMTTLNGRSAETVARAKSAGMRAVHIPNSDVPPFDDAVPDAVISRLSELPALLDKW